ncbi:hypothetical protein WICMUC_000372 [Wickerhamomyces mucosus]|uniref:acid phosphatase n=1 Tax=Wickerhamomyces mucosus TaxID=1378264 RepID=A0A9P8PZA9_9ASCO|nr:hypothetical protein WICMUC_000372 [Wickerhamomyces mucosus]
MKFSLGLSSLIGAVTIVEAASEGYPLKKPYSQDAVEQYNKLRFLGTTGPYVSFEGYGISPETPYNCEVTQAHLFSRHFERYATASTGASNKKIIEKLKNITVSEYVGPLAFLKDYEYYVKDSAYLELESENGYYSGLADGYNLGNQLRAKYSHLFDGESVHPVFASSKTRVVESAQAFAKGFFGRNYTDLASIQPVSESAKMGANTLTSSKACVNYNSSTHDDIVSQFNQSYLDQAAIRLNYQSPGFNLTGSDVSSLLSYCGFELNVRGFSPVCEIFTHDELVSFAYAKSLAYYYESGPGYSEITGPMGYVYANSTYTLMEQGESYPYNLTFSFSHDSNFENFLTILGLFNGEYDMIPDYIDLQHPWKVSQLVPMGARLIHEKLQCTDYSTNKTEDYVRILLNDAVIPIPDCQDGPGFSCPLDGYKEVIDSNLGNTTYVEACGVNSTYPQYTSFYWDWDVTFANN